MRKRIKTPGGVECSAWLDLWFSFAGTIFPLWLAVVRARFRAKCAQCFAGLYEALVRGMELLLCFSRRHPRLGNIIYQVLNPDPKFRKLEACAVYLGFVQKFDQGVDFGNEIIHGSNEIEISRSRVAWQAY